MSERTLLKRFLNKKELALEALDAEVQEIEKSKSILIQREAAVFKQRDLTAKDVADLRKLLENGNGRTRTVKPRPAEAVVVARDAIPLILTTLRLYGITESKAVDIKELFSLVVDKRKGWEGSFDSFRALISTLHRSPIKEAKKIGVKKVGRLNHVYLKPSRRRSK